MIKQVDDMNLKKELRWCQLFPVESEHERAGQKVFNYAEENLNASIVDEKLDHFFNNLKCAAKVNLASGFIFINIKSGGFRCFFTHTKTIPCWIDPNLCAPKMTWQGEKFFSTKLTSSIRVVEKDGTQSGGSTT